MTRISIKHRISYHYDRKVFLSGHLFRLSPFAASHSQIETYSLRVQPAHRLYWQHDVYGNQLARVDFADATESMAVDVAIDATLKKFNPFELLVESDASQFPFVYPEPVRMALWPYLQPMDTDPALDEFIESTNQFRGETLSFLVSLNRLVFEQIRYTQRMEEGVQSCALTLKSRSGSCRDSAWLIVQVARRLGLASRFVSGYLVQLDTATGDTVDLHAWAEVFVPGAGWIGLDTTSGLFTSEGHIPLAVGPGPEQVAPVEGTTGVCISTMEYESVVERR
jgi:transglutaminase-like putative cysteine protease